MTNHHRIRRPSVTGCAATGSTVKPCTEVTARLIAADRDERELGLDGAELRRRARLIAAVHLAELDHDGCGT